MNDLPAARYSGLSTDLYELTMAAGYFQSGFRGRASFELFSRRLPPRRNFLVAAGLEQALDFLENVCFTPEEIAYLRALPVFRHVTDEFFDYLAQFRFTGDVWAMPEGTIAFPGEPLLRVTAPVIEAQIAETRLLAALNFQTMVASRAARIVLAAAGRPVVEFGARRAHGNEAGILAARASWIAGCEGTSNVLAGHEFAIPVYGTQAHSWVMAFADEAQAFERFLDIFPGEATLLLDTYDVRAALAKIIAGGRKPHGVRLDSGDMARDSCWVRRELQRTGWPDVQVFASGDLDENRIEKLLRAGAEIDAFGVGSAIVAPSDTRNLSMVYKLVEIEAGGATRETAKLSEEKVSYAGAKQVFREMSNSGRLVGKWSRDSIALADEKHAGSALLREVMRGGKRIAPRERLEDSRARCREGFACLPPRLLSVSRETSFPVHYSAKLKALQLRVRREIRVSESRAIARSRTRPLTRAKKS